MQHVQRQLVRSGMEVGEGQQQTGEGLGVPDSPVLQELMQVGEAAAPDQCAHQHLRQGVLRGDAVARHGAQVVQDHLNYSKNTIITLYIYTEQLN